jgi:hypothetical protein
MPQEGDESSSCCQIAGKLNQATVEPSIMEFSRGRYFQTTRQYSDLPGCCLAGLTTIC